MIYSESAIPTIVIIKLNDFLIIDMLEWIQKVRERYVSKNSKKRSEAEKDT